MMRKLTLLLATLILLAAAPAGAIVFTLENPVALNQNGVSGTINPVLGFVDLMDPLLISDVGGNLVPDEGGVSFAGVDVFVVDITLDGGSASIDAIGITVSTPQFFLNPVGAGAFDDGGGLTEPTSVLADNQVQLGGQFDFSGDTIDAGETTVRLFLTYSPLGDLQIGQQVNFMVSAGTDFTVIGTTLPEPTTALLVGGGLLAIALARPRRA